MADYKYVGKPHPRVDGPAKVTGAAEYVQDMVVTGMLYARLVLSPHAHAKIKSIDAVEAEKLPGVHAVLTGQELDNKVGLYMIDKDILAKDVVRYDGEPVAAVAAETEWIAEQACKLIKVEYEVLDAVLDPRKAIEKDSPLVHPDLAHYDYMKGVFHPKANSNIPHHQKIRKGNVDVAFEKADLVFEYQFNNPPVSHGFMETHVAIVKALPEERAEIITSAQSPYTVRNLFSVCFGIPHSKIRVKIPYVGGGFGGKAGIHLEPLVYCLSKKAGYRPVKLTITREESLKTMPARQGLYSEFKIGVSHEGKIEALKVNYYWDAGAYADYGVNIGRAAATAGAGPYEVPNCHIDSYVVYTNKTFGTAYRGFGHLEVLWGVERTMDLVAYELGLDPYEFRQKNVLRLGATTITGEKIGPSHGRVDKCLEKVAKEIEWGEVVKYDNGQVRYSGKKPADHGKNGIYYGKGLALLHKAPAMPTFTSCSAFLKLNEDASADLLISGVDYGQGTYTALTQIVAEELKIAVEKVNVTWDCDTAFSPYDWQTVASRFAFMGGNATIQAAKDCIKQIKEVASAVLRAPIEELVCEDGRVFVNHHPDHHLTYEQLAMGYSYPNGNSIGGPIIGRGKYIAQGLTHLDAESGQGLPALDWTYGAHGVEIKIDTNTGEIEILKIASAFDLGQVLNEQQVHTQIVGGVLQGVGSALFEEYVHDEKGRFTNASFVDYKIPSAKDMPVKTVPLWIETPQVDGPYGARGVAEHPMISIPGAIGNAIFDALGLDFFELPLNSERVYFGFKQQGDKAIFRVPLK